MHVIQVGFSLLHEKGKKQLMRAMDIEHHVRFDWMMINQSRSIEKATKVLNKTACRMSVCFPKHVVDQRSGWFSQSIFRNLPTSLSKMFTVHRSTSNTRFA